MKPLISLILFLPMPLVLLGQPAPPQPRITEIMYRSPVLGNDSLEFIEIGGSLSTDIGGWYFSSGIDFTFPETYMLLTNEVITIANDSVAFQNTFGYPAFQWNNSNLPDSGVPIVFKRNNGYLQDSVYYNAEAWWPTEANGQGASLERCFPNCGISGCFVASTNQTGIVVEGLELFASPGDYEPCILNSVQESLDSVFTQIYPNPATTNLTVESRTPLAQVWVRDVAGRPSIHHPLVADGTQDDGVVIDVSGLPSGIYLVEALTQNGQRAVQKVVVN